MKAPERIEVNIEELEAILEDVRGMLSASKFETLQAAVKTLAWLVAVLRSTRVSLRRVRRMLFGPTSEKTKDVLGGQGDGRSGECSGADGGSPSDGEDGSSKTRRSSGKGKRKGHGRNPASAYTGANKNKVEHQTLKPGDACPECKKGKLYELSEPAVIVCVIGQPPVMATVHECQRLRCNPCGAVFTAEAPEEASRSKYGATSAAMIALLKYGSGMPFNRLERLQRDLGIPLPASTQYEVVAGGAEKVAPAYEELIRQAAQGEVVHNDDTPARILDMMNGAAGKSSGASSEAGPAGEKSERERTGLFTSAVVALVAGIGKIALFFTGRAHAGENLESVLDHRANDLEPPIQMCDALSRNYPSALKTILALCIVHARRKFVDLVPSFPSECRFVIETLAQVFHVDAFACRWEFSPAQRLKLHQRISGPLMDELHTWMKAQIDEQKVEPNSPMGDAISYMTKPGRWEKFTLFLRVEGVPLNNNLCERVLKKAILHRRNSLFFKTAKGARVADIYMSLIHTAELMKVNPFDYLVALLEHPAEVKSEPSKWMPWNFRSMLAAMAKTAA